MLQLQLTGMLKEKGWFKSFYKKQSIDKSGNPLPWYTYSFINFIEDRIQKDFEVFEYGSGNSTLWWANRVEMVDSVESDKKWFEQIKSQMPQNVNLNYEACEDNENGKYAKKVLNSGNKYNLIIVDGKDRNNCIHYSISALKNNGVIILDNSNREIYQSAFEELKANDFKRIDFYGVSPIVPFESATSIFYKIDNCINI